MHRSTRRRFLQSAVPAASLIAMRPTVAHGQMADVGVAENAASYARQFIRDKELQLHPKSGNRIAAVGCIYGMAATIESANGSPIAVSFVKGHGQGGAAHEPVLWAMAAHYDAVVAPDKKTANGECVGWVLTGKTIWFEAPPNSVARYLQPAEMTHHWQAPKNIPLLNEIQPGAKGLALAQIEAQSNAMLTLNQGVLEPGVPWSNAGRIGLWRYAPIADESKMTPAQKTTLHTISDNELWSFWLPENATTIRVMYRPLGNAKAKPSVLATLKRVGNAGGISFFLSNDVPEKKYDKKFRPVARDAKHFWLATSHAKNDGVPTLMRTVYGHADYATGTADNDGEPHCTRARIRLG